jgi:hypothetical protein
MAQHANSRLIIVNIIHSKSICFVRYKNRVCAEFAKEAMADQSLDDDEVINVRWANTDPNPVAQERDAIALVAEAADVFRAKNPEQWEMQMAMMKEQYPNTDGQYAIANGRYAIQQLSSLDIS